jgi:uncharacterized protein YciI
MAYFFFKLVPARPDFSGATMTDEDRQIMQEHVAYWTDQRDKGVALIFGPVHDPKGVFGVGIIEIEDEAAAQQLSVDDPAVKSGLQRTEIYPMPRLVRS